MASAHVIVIKRRNINYLSVVQEYYFTENILALTRKRLNGSKGVRRKKRLAKLNNNLMNDRQKNMSNIPLLLLFFGQLLR